MPHLAPTGLHNCDALKSLSSCSVHDAGVLTRALHPSTHDHAPLRPPEPGTNYHAVFPAGTIYVRCGWVSEHVEPGTRLADAAAPAMLTYDNPLADRPDIESGKVLMPPQPRIPVDRMLRRAAERIGGKVGTSLKPKFGMAWGGVARRPGRLC